MNEEKSLGGLAWLGIILGICFILWAISFGFYALASRSAPQAPTAPTVSMAQSVPQVLRVPQGRRVPQARTA
jgi:hypothetical protein